MKLLTQFQGVYLRIRHVIILVLLSLFSMNNLSTAPAETSQASQKDDGAPMVLVPAGEFLFGDNNQRISLPAFFIDKYEVTTNLYGKFLHATSRTPPSGWSQTGFFTRDRPVTYILWGDAAAYCTYYGKRLPTEHEWEKAARGTDGRKYPWGDDEPTDRRSNFGKHWSKSMNPYSELLKPVGSYEDGKSPYGIYDLAGNVDEWTSSDYESPRSKVLRGGDWSRFGNRLRASYRNADGISAANASHGFRCAKDATQ